MDLKPIDLHNSAIFAAFMKSGLDITGILNQTDQQNQFNMRLKSLVVLALLFVSQQLFSQENYKSVSKADSTKTYLGGKPYEVKTFTQKFKTKKPRNVIMMIGDGMGVAHIYAGYTANGGHLFLDNFKQIAIRVCQVHRTGNTRIETVYGAQYLNGLFHVL